MAMRINECRISGNLTRDPELKSVGDTEVCSFGLATDGRVYKKKDSDDYEREPVFLNCEVWGWQTKIISDLKKGAPVMIDATFMMDKWEKDGEERTAPKFRANKVWALAAAPRTEGAGNNTSAPAEKPAGKPRGRKPASQTPAENKPSETGVPF